MAGLVVLEKMVMLVLLMLVGFLAAKGKWVDESFGQKASFLVANVFIVATILASVVGMEPLFSGEELVLAVAAVFVLFSIGGILGWVCARLLPLTPGDRTAAWLSVFFMNNVFIGFPVVEALFGPSAVFCAALTGLPFNLLLFSLGVSRLRAGQGRGRVRLKEVFSPALVATLVSIVFFLGQIPFPQLVADTVQTLGGATVPLSMVIIGISLIRFFTRSKAAQGLGKVPVLRFLASPKGTMAVLLGSVIYKFCVQIAISAGLPANMLKFITAALFLVVLVIAGRKGEEIIHA